jgi:homoserine O-succinyltransferase
MPSVPRLKIGIVNNMPDSALVATDRQFSQLAMAAAGGAAEILRFHIPSVPRGDDARQHLRQNYLPVDALYGIHVDALIITGNEPRAARLDDEPYWPELTRLTDWAMDKTQTTIWSCLAAHAAVLHLDGIERHRMPQKKSGVLRSAVRFAEARGLPSSLVTCHSRLNEIRPGDLLSHGYEIVSEAAGGHVDVFAKTYFHSRFVFLQGHPEYEADSLLKEYRRDVGRFLRSERDLYPEVPENYFDDETTLRLENFRMRAERERDIRLFDAFPQSGIRPGLSSQMAESAAAVFANALKDVKAAS